MVENNDFKQLPHICLAFRLGSDAAVKQFLAFRLGELRSDASALSAELERTQVQRGVRVVSGWVDGWVGLGGRVRLVVRSLCQPGGAAGCHAR